MCSLAIDTDLFRVSILHQTREASANGWQGDMQGDMQGMQGDMQGMQGDMQGVSINASEEQVLSYYRMCSLAIECVLLL